MMQEYKQIKYINDSGFGPAKEEILYARRTGDYMEIFNELGWKLLAFSLEGPFNLGQAVGEIAKNFETLDSATKDIVKFLPK